MPKYFDLVDEQRIAFGTALKAACEKAGISSQIRLAEVLTEAGAPFAQTTCGTWFRGEAEPSRSAVLLLEELTGCAPGELSRHLGWVPLEAVDFPTAEAAILADPDLTPSNARALIAALRAMKEG